MADHSAQNRRDLAKQGKAMSSPDGPPKFPIADAADLKAAIRLHGQVPDAQKPAVRRHIIRNAKRLNLGQIVPDQWNTDGSVSA